MATFGLFLYLVILISIFIFIMYYIEVNVVFYSSIYSVLISLVLYSGLVVGLSSFSIFNNFEKFNLIFIALLIGYAVAISVPTVIDRSLSFYILEKLQQRGGKIQLSKFNYIFTEEYMREHRLVDVRLTEQIESGTIFIQNDCVFLTDKGDKLAKFSGYFRKHLLPRKRLLRGVYTDELLNPFAKSDLHPDYLCK